MAITRMNEKHLKEVQQLWNRTDKGGMLYKPMDMETFRTKFHTSTEKLDIKTFIDRREDRIRGFISGVVVKDRQKVYITMVLVDEDMRRQGIGSELIRHFEKNLKKHYPHLRITEIIFFNPVPLEWVIPGTDNHDHPNAPGVLSDSEAHHFFSHHGYHTFAKQNVYYKDIENYTYENSIETLIDALAKRGMHIGFYDPRTHTGLDALLENLENPYWKEIITTAAQQRRPILIAQDRGRIVGFTGPLDVEVSRRGYFAGIGVHSSARGLGLGKVLFSSLCKELSAMGADYMSLFTGENNPARKIYEKEHFKIVASFANMRKENDV